MRLSRRSYPHPVVGNLDDVPGAAFQAIIEMSVDQDDIYIDATVQCSSATIRRLAEKGKAAYLIHAECTNTLFRRGYQFSAESERITIRADQLNDAVEVNVFAVATHDMADYVVEGSHSDYEGVTFDVRKGDILAVGEGRTFPIESTHDALGRIGTIMQIDAAVEDGDLPMEIDFNGDKIRIILSKPDFKTYKEMRTSEALSSVLTTIIVLPALEETLYYIDGGDAEELEIVRWYRALRRRIESLGLQHETDKLTKVQKLLELPIRRAFATAYNLAEASS